MTFGPLPPQEPGIYTEEFEDWFESTAHTTSGDPFHSGARCGWVAAMRFIKGKIASEDEGKVLIDALRSAK